MVEGIIFWAKAVILTEVFCNAARSWGIFDNIRSTITTKVDFFRRLLECFECTSVWAATFTIFYLTFFEVELFTYILIAHRLACFLHLGFEYGDAARAVKEKEI